MFTPIATDASPRASRLEATTRSCAESTPSPPSSTGTGAVKYPAALSASIASNGKLPSRSWSRRVGGELPRERLGDRHEAIAGVCPWL